MKQFLHKHHITPLHDGGADEPENIVMLTPAQHARKHYERWKEKGQTKDYQAYCLLKSWIKSGVYNPERMIAHGEWLGRTHGVRVFTAEHQKRAAAKLAEKYRNGFTSPLKGRKYNTEEKRTIYPRATCPNCGKTGNARAMKQWHGTNGEKCKSGRN